MIFDIDSIAKAFELAVKDNDDISSGSAITISELANLTGKGEAWVRKHIRILIGAGQWEMVKIPRYSIANVRLFVPAYRPKAIDNE